MLSEDLGLLVFPGEVKAIRNTTQGSAEVLIQWPDLPNFSSTWESVDVVKTHFPSFHLEDKVTLLGVVRTLFKNALC
jgi:hypothetical protein